MMACKYEATKTLQRAHPMLVENSDIVHHWTLTYIYEYEDFQIEYNVVVDTEHLQKTPTQFTKTELRELTNFDVIDPTFEVHYESHLKQKSQANQEPVPFNFDQLPD